MSAVMLVTPKKSPQTKRAAVTKRRAAVTKRADVTMRAVATKSDSGDDEDTRATRRDGFTVLEDAHVVEGILEGPNDEGEYLIKWKGFKNTSNAWEPAAHIPDHLLEEHLADLVPLYTQITPEETGEWKLHVPSDPIRNVHLGGIFVWDLPPPVVFLTPPGSLCPPPPPVISYLIM
jgi:hypothetical protein